MARPHMTNAGTQVQRDDIRSQLRKTHLCVFHMEGRCHYGTQCLFAHDSGEVAATPDLTKTSICEKWRQGQCNNTGATCYFAHGVHELRTTPEFVRAHEQKAAIRNKEQKPTRLEDKGHTIADTLDDMLAWKTIELFQAMKAQSRISADDNFGLWEERIGAPVLSVVAPPLGLPSTWMSESMDGPMKVKVLESLKNEVQGSIPFTESSIPFPEKLIRKCTRNYESEGATTILGSKSDDRSSRSQLPTSFETSFVHLRF